MGKDTPIIGIAAWSGSGKTTLLEKLIAELKNRGVRTAVIKHDVHGFEMDKPGKDTWRFSQAGAAATVISSGDKTALIEHRGRGLMEAVSLVENVDLILVEGYKSEDIPQIGLCRKDSGKPFTAPLERFMAVVTDVELPEDMKIPCFSLEDVQGITEFIMKNMDDFTHFNAEGRARMVDVGAKDVTRRTAVAAGRVLVSPETLALIQSGGMKKGDVLTVAQIAGVMGAKKTPELIPMCHPTLVDGIDLSLSLDEDLCAVEITATVTCAGRTGVEMEALTAVSTAALTVYDMCKAVQKDMVIADIRLLEKTGGVHGDFHREEEI